MTNKQQRKSDKETNERRDLEDKNLSDSRDKNDAITEQRRHESDKTLIRNRERNDQKTAERRKNKDGKGGILGISILVIVLVFVALLIIL